MKTFKDLKFKKHPHGNGKIARLNFKNGYGVSVTRFTGGIFGDSYTSNDKEWELAVLKDDRLCYETPITDDVIGHLKSDKVTKIMKQVQELPKVKVKQ